jgi:ankyrin repeat protein
MIPSACRVTRALLFSCLFAGEIRSQAPAKLDFARDVQPIFRAHCVECHGPSQQMRGLRLDRRRDVVPNRVGANGARVVAGDSARSVLYRRITATQPAQRMPPSAPLSPEQVTILKTWIDQGADWPDELSGERATTAADPAAARIMDALRRGDRPQFDRLVREQPDAVNARGIGGWTPLMYAALYGDEQAVRVLLDRSAKPNDQNDAGGTALMYAVDDVDKTRLLLERGADPNLRSGEGRTALLIAVGRPGCYPVVKLLLDKGAGITARLPDGRGGLPLAVIAGDPDLLRLLLERGIEKKPVPLTLALALCPSCFDLMLPLAESSDFTAALPFAVRFGDLPRLKILMDRGALPVGNTLQTVAMSSLPPDTTRTLIRAGANVNAKTSTGLSMIEFARRQGNHDLVQALTEAGARDENVAAPDPPRSPAPSAKVAVERVIPLLQRSDIAFLQKAGCVSCHNNSLTAMTISAARATGIRIDEPTARDQLRKIAAFMQENVEKALENDGIPGGVDTVSYILLGMAVEGYPGDATTDAWTRYLKNAQRSDGHWRCQALRPPLESSDFEVTAATLRALKTYGPASQRSEYDKAVARAIQWLESAQPRNTEDAAFKILGLIWGGGSRRAISATAQELVKGQGADGGWSQLKTLAADAYATGQALVALRESRAISVSSPTYRKGVRYLMSLQLEDGSWHVKSRAPAIQPYFDSDFPHGTDQFISAAASNWAAMALISASR